MRGGLFISEASGLYTLIRSTLATTGAYVSDDGDFVQVGGEAASSALLYRPDDQWRLPPLEPSHGPADLDLSRMHGVMVECRSPLRVLELAEAIDAAAEEQVWFLDADDVAWPTARLDPGRLSL